MALSLAFVGCDQNGVRVYEVPKEEQAPPAPAAAANPHGDNPHMGGMASLPKLTWTLPEGWSELPSAGIQAANFSINNPDGQASRLTVVPLPDLMADEKEIVNLWRESLSLPPATDETLPGMSEPTDIAGKEGKLYRFSAELGAIHVAVVKHAGVTWFFKMRGDMGHMDSELDSFKSFLTSVDFTAAPTPPAGGMTGMATSPGSASSSGNPNWTVPAGWNEEAPGPMLSASFGVSGSSGQSAKITVSALGGNAGGLLPNINRWCGQIGIAPITEGDLDSVVSPLELSSGSAQLVELNNESQSQTMVVAIVPVGARTWFYKMLGDTALVSEQRAPFLEFVKSAGQ